MTGDMEIVAAATGVLRKKFEVLCRFAVFA
jgi:hypothetical protein